MAREKERIEKATAEEEAIRARVERKAATEVKALVTSTNPELEKEELQIEG